MRISADVIDEDQCNGCDFQDGNKIGTKVRVVVRDSAKAETSLEDILKKFQNLSICFHDPMSSNMHSSELKNAEERFLMEGASSASSQPPVDQDGSHSPVEITRLPFWYNKMKAELKKEVIEEVLKSFNQKFLSKPTDDECKQHDVKTNSGIAPEGGQDVLHSGVVCDNCDQQIRGVRYKCGNCEDFDLCEKCESEDLHNKHDISHIFLKIRIPSCFFTLQEGTRKKIFQVPLKSIDSSDSVVLNNTSIGKLDAETDDGKDCLGAKFICDETVPDGTAVYPGMKFVKTWRVCNSGTKPWTKDTVFRLVCSFQELKPCRKEVLAPQLRSGEEGIVSVSFTAPDSYGVYESYWEFQHLGKSFGDTLWCKIRVDPIQPLELLPLNAPNRNSALRALKFQHHQYLLKNKRKVKEEKRKKRENRRKEVKQIVDVLAAVRDDQDSNGSGIGQGKPVVTSQTATPNNTPFDLTPPKSPEPRVDIKSKIVVSTREAIQRLEEKLNNVSICPADRDDKASITTLSSSESDSEFVVIPMPKCFTLPLAAGQVSQLQVPKTVAAGVVDADKENSLSNAITKEPENAPAVSFEKQGNAESISQETGVPEDSENVNLITTIHLKGDCEKNLIVSNISLSCSPSSSSISIVGSESNSPTDKTLAHNIPSPTNEVCNKRSFSPTVHVSLPVDEQHEETVASPSCTFPKFPLNVESENSTGDVSTVNVEKSAPEHEERTIQVLPEGLVTGALLAAATVYNTARAVIGNLQPGRNDEEESSPQPTAIPSQSPLQMSPADQLLEMGFCNRVLNEQLLRENNNDVARVVAELVSLNDNDWYASRHNPNSSAVD